MYLEFAIKNIMVSVVILSRLGSNLADVNIAVYSFGIDGKVPNKDSINSPVICFVMPLLGLCVLSATSEMTQVPSCMSHVFSLFLG